MPAITNIFACPTCGAKTKVLRTRSALPQRLTRYRICESGHRTTTREIVDSDMNAPRNTVDRTLVTIALCELAASLGIQVNSTTATTSFSDNHFHGDSNAN